MTSSNAWVESLGWMLIHSVWLISLIVGVSAVGLGLLRRRSANVRYLFACVALLLSWSTLPAVLVWGLTRSVTPEEFGTVVSTQSLTVDGGDIVDIDGPGETVRVDAGPELQGQPVPLEISTLRDHDGRLGMPVDAPRPAEAHATTPIDLTVWQQVESQLRPHLALLVSGWLAGVCLLSVRPLIGWYSARRLQRVGLSEVSDSLKEMLSSLCDQLGLRRTVRIFQSSLVQIPCVVGALRPVILLPASAITGLSPEQLDALLAHELAHIQRHDFAVNFVQTLVETLLFYHPAIWWLSRQVRQEREHCCDDLAISACGDVACYARMLVSVEALRGRVPQTSVAASGGSLVERIRRIAPSPHEQPRSPWLSGSIVLGTLVVLASSWQWTVGQVSNLPKEAIVVEPPNFGGSVSSTPVFVDGTLFIATKDSLVAIRDPKQSTELKIGAAPLTINEDVFKPLECRLVDAVTGQPIAENTRDVEVVVRSIGTTKPHLVTTTTKTHSYTLAVSGSFHFIKPKTGDESEKRVTLRVYASKSSNQITLLIPDQVMRRADRDELLLEWQLGNAPVYENYEPIERIPLKRLLSHDPRIGRDSFRTIKLTPKQKAGVPPAAPTAASWTSFRHDLAQTGVATTPLPNKLERLWETSLGEQVVGTAAIVGDHVYVPCLSGELVCLDRKTGRRLWAYRSVSEVKPNSFAPGFQSSPTVTSTAIYLGDEDGVFHAIDRATGTPRWTFKTDGEIFSSAAVVGDKVLFGSYDSHLYCLNEQDGTLAWNFATQGKVHCAPAVVDGLVLIAGCDEHLRAIDIATGTQKRDISLGSYLIASPAVVGDLAFVGTYGNEVLAVNRKTGDVLWRYSPEKGEFPFHSSAAVTETLVVLGGRDKLVHGIDRATGRPLWTFATSGKVDSSPVVVGQRVFIGSDDGNLYELDAATGELRAKFNLGQPISASPAIGEGVLVIGSQSSDGKVVCFGQSCEVQATDAAAVK